jgi:cell filamentation protein
MYEAGDDPYCYPGTTVLRNRLGLRDQAELEEFEALITPSAPASRCRWKNWT